MLLYKINRSPFSHKALEHCLARLQQKDGVLLIEDGVYAAADNHQNETLLKAVSRLYALENDLAARGVDNVVSHCQRISYAQMVNLCVEFEQVIAWE